MEKKQMNINNESNEVKETNVGQIPDKDQVTKEEKVNSEETTIGMLFQRIATDESFKELLISNPDEALSGYELTTTQEILIKSLSEEDLDKLTPDNLDEFFAADAAVYTPDEADLMDFEEYDPEDFEENE